MADKQKHEGYPKIYVKGANEQRSTRLASTPVDGVNFESRGYVEDEDATKKYQAAAESQKTEASSEGGADEASAVTGSAEAKPAEAEPKTEAKPAEAPKATAQRPPTNR